MAPPLTNAIIIYLCIGLFLHLGGVGTSDGVPELLSDFVNITENGTYSSVVMSGQLANVQPNVNEESGAGTGILQFIDALKSVRVWVEFAWGVIFAVPTLFLTMPFIVQLLIGIPLSIYGIMSLLYFVRSGQ